MSQASRSRPSRISARRSPRRLSPASVLLRLALLALVAGLLGVAGFLLASRLNQHSPPSSLPIDLPADPSLNPLQAAALGSYLAMNREGLDTPPGSDPTPVSFTVLPGQSAAEISEMLAAQGLISDPVLFRTYLRYYGLDRQMEAGTYQLLRTMTIPEIALALTQATPPEVVVRVTEGWRREQIAESLDQQSDLPFSGADFLAATAALPPLPPGSSLAGVIPGGSSLEGFLFPDTYRLAVDASAADLVSRMLQTFDQRVTPEMRNDAAARGMTLFEVITLASIVEREAAVADERPLIASVYLNRLQAGIKLEADPTVQYGMGYQADSGQWWNLDLTQEDYLLVDSPYNTYLYPGMPPGPIASPGLDSIRAVIYPAESPFLFFRAACDGSGRHRFAVTYEEHVANACP